MPDPLTGNTQRALLHAQDSSRQKSHNQKQNQKAKALPQLELKKTEQCMAGNAQLGFEETQKLPVLRGRVVSEPPIGAPGREQGKGKKSDTVTFTLKR